MRILKADNEKPVRTTHRKSSGMWCESCDQMTLAVWTTTRIFKNGKEIERQKCEECGTVQETEYFKGPTTRIKNREK